MEHELTARDTIYPHRVATVEVLEAVSEEQSKGVVVCRVVLRCKDASLMHLEGSGQTLDAAVAGAVATICHKPITARSSQNKSIHGRQRVVVHVTEIANESSRAGVGRYELQEDDTRLIALVVATIRAASHAGLLRAAYRANNQKILRNWACELMQSLSETLEVSSLPEINRLEAEGQILESMNRVASAAVITASNHPRPETILSLFDTSAWLFDAQGRRRDSYTDTDLWLAWYPGIENDELTVNEVINSMPAAPESKIPWIVKLFENPESWIRFRGAVDLEDHDVMHVLLGRGLQDQDEAFVIGFAMGTAKKVSWFQYWVFKFVLARLYPEPYRIPRFLQPAFNLGVQCGQDTGARDLYRHELKALRKLPLREARRQAQIDMSVVRSYYEQEQQRIPFTIASLRLP